MGRGSRCCGDPDLSEPGHVRSQGPRRPRPGQWPSESAPSRHVSKLHQLAAPAEEAQIGRLTAVSWTGRRPAAAAAEAAAAMPWCVTVTRLHGGLGDSESGSIQSFGSVRRVRRVGLRVLR